MPHIALAATWASLIISAAADNNGCAQENGNWYCQQTNGVTYSNFGQAGSYNKVTSMDPNSGTCASQKQSYAGGLAPLDDEVSWHFRGPLKLKQFAFYTLGQAGPAQPQKGKRSEESAMLARAKRKRHAHHAALHRGLEEPEVAFNEDIVVDEVEAGFSDEEEFGGETLDARGMGEWVTVTMNGHVVSWQNQFGGMGSPGTALLPKPSPVGAGNNGWNQGQANNNGNTSPPGNTNPGGQQQQRPQRPNPADAAASIGPPVAQPSATGANPAQPQSQPQAQSPAAPSAGQQPPQSNPSSPAVSTTTISLISPQAGSAPTAAAPSPQPAANTEPSTGSAWTRQSYYSSSSPGTANNIVFLGNHGGQGCSGTFDYKYGMSLSYVDTMGQNCSAQPQPLSDTVLPDNTEISIFASAKCSASSPCPYTRPGTVAHHGFGGTSKLFLVEFAMPVSGKKGWNMDMPAAWILNAQIPRTLQYGKAECSCWQSGCGEFDVMEVLDSGNLKMKSTWHGQGATGDSHWFQRPTGGSKKAAVVMDGSKGKVSVLWLDDSVDFGSGLSVEVVQGWVGKVGVQATLGAA